MIIQTIFLAILLSVSLANAQETRDLSLVGAQKLALEQNLEYKTLAKKIEVLEASEGRALSFFLPKLGAESRYEKFDSELVGRSGATSHLFAEYNLFNGFQDRSNWKATSLELQQTRLQLEQLERTLRWDVELAFCKLLKVKQSMAAYNETLARNQTQKEMAKKRRSAGLVSEADVLEFDLFEANLKSDLALLKGDMLEAQAELRAKLGIDERLEVIPNGKLNHYHVKETLAAALERIPKENANVLASQMEVERSEVLSSVARGGFLPKIDLKATYGSQGLRATEVAPETTIMAVARWEFFSGLDTYYALSQARAREAQSEFAHRFALINAKNEVEKGMTRLLALQERVDLEAGNLERSKKYFQTVADEYRRGVKNSPDLKSASSMLLETTLRDVQYRYEFFEQKNRVQRAIGGEIQVARGSLEGHTD